MSTSEKVIRSHSGQGALVSVRCHLWWLDDLENLLDDENVKRLKNSCFGHLFETEDIQFQGQLYHILVKNCLNKESEGDGRMTFTIHDKVLEFGPVEYSAICGLRWDGWYEPSATLEIHRVVFQSKPSLKFCDISKALVDECKSSQGKSELCLKLALLYVLYSVVMIRDKNSKNIQKKYLHLADSVDAFNAYAWGKVSYEYMVMATHSRRGIIDNLIAEKKKMAYDAYGFVTALQCWAYEIMPDMARYCTEVSTRNEGRFPRLLRWKATQYFQYDDLMRFFDDRDRVSDVVQLVPSEEEWEFLQTLGLDRSQQVPTKLRLLTPNSAQKRKLIAAEVDVKGGSAKRKRTEGVPESIRKSPRFVLPAVHEVIAESKSPARVAALFGDVPVEASSTNSTLIDIEAHLREICKRMQVFEKVVGCWKKCGFCGRPESPESEKKKTEKDRFDGEAGVEEKKAASGLELGAKVRADKGSATPPASPHVQAAPSGMHGLTPISKSPKEAATNEEDDPIGGRLSIFVEVASHLNCPSTKYFEMIDVKRFTDWYTEGLKMQTDVFTPLPTQCKTEASARWFYSMFESEKWLTDEQVDAVINLLIYKSKNYTWGAPSVEGWTALELHPTGVLQSDNYTLNLQAVMGYVRGSYPRQGGMSWVRADRIFGVANVRGDHWVCYEISFAAQKITVYDSMGKTRSGNMKKPDRIILNMAKAVPWVCKEAGVWKDKKMASKLRDVWEVEMSDKAPQQKNGFDCGIMSLKFLECLITGTDMSVIEIDRCTLFRKAYCAELYKLGLAHPAE